jgi:hypothetical protein
LEACPRREVWAASNLEETRPADLQGWIARLSSRPRNCACKRRSVPPSRAANLATHGHKGHDALLGARGRRSSARSAGAGSIATNVGITTASCS